MKYHHYRSKKEYVISFLKNHPYWGYPQIEKEVHYGIPNIANLATQNGLNRNGRSIRKLCKEELTKMVREDNIDYDYLYKKYGLKKKSIRKEIQQLPYCGEKKENKVLRLLREYQCGFPVAAYLAGTNVFYVTQIAKKHQIVRTNGTIQDNIRALFEKDEDMTCLQASQIIKQDIDTVLQNLPNASAATYPVTDFDDEIIKACKEGQPFVFLSIQYQVDEYVIESLLSYYGIDMNYPLPQKAAILSWLKAKPKDSYTLIANACSCSIHDVHKIAEQNGLDRFWIKHTWSTRFEVLKTILECPEMSYSAIGEKYNKTPVTISLFAKEHGIARKNPLSLS